MANANVPAKTKIHLYSPNGVELRYVVDPNGWEPSPGFIRIFEANGKETTFSGSYLIEDYPDQPA